MFIVVKSHFEADVQESFLLCGITQNDLKLIFLLNANGLLSNDVKSYLGLLLTARKKSAKL